MFNYSINLPQVKNLLSELGKLNKIEQSKATLYLSHHQVSTISQVKHSVHKVKNYLSTWTGWSTDLRHLPNLSKKILTFTKASISSKEKWELQKKKY